MAPIGLTRARELVRIQKQPSALPPFRVFNNYHPEIFENNDTQFLFPSSLFVFPKHGRGQARWLGRQPGAELCRSAPEQRRPGGTVSAPGSAGSKNRPDGKQRLTG